MKNKIVLSGIFFLSGILYAQSLSAQGGYWQQKAEYTIDVNFDHTKHQFAGKQKIVYYNNSADTLTKVFCVMYFEAGSNRAVFCILYLKKNPDSQDTQDTFTQKQVIT